MRQQLLIEEVKALRARVAYLEGILTGPKPVGLFHTPASKQELEDWVFAHKDPHVTTAYVMTYNFIVSQQAKAVEMAPAMPESAMGDAA